MTAPQAGGIGTGLSIIGTGLNVYGALSKGKADKRMYDYRAGVADINAKIAKQNADWAREAGGKEALRAGIAARQTKGRIISKQAASGLEVNFGSNLDVQESQQLTASMDQAQIRENAARTAYGYEVEAFNQTSSANMLRTAGANAKKASKWQALGSLVSGASSVASKWSQAKQTGMTGQRKGLLAQDDDMWYY